MSLYGLYSLSSGCALQFCSQVSLLRSRDLDLLATRLDAKDDSHGSTEIDNSTITKTSEHPRNMRNITVISNRQLTSMEGACSVRLTSFGISRHGQGSQVPAPSVIIEPCWEGRRGKLPPPSLRPLMYAQRPRPSRHPTRASLIRR
ncbi:hypothetical protein CONLIGDRAFT_629122 [Coniochaeta ligniaria NRRL 30616]|uniref:Uncharacterized protein n=1 Tax=Coniochaeta ligniaria NRRL 30616 TaxID=1408157 RepID=A0A1J7K211_9PEZI|nr:hypothetical protein CONLIGDRAFT_629122 [Coniochaeta ligniaria NRRL 30616]